MTAGAVLGGRAPAWRPPAARQVLAVIALLAAWEIAARATAGSFVIAGPTDVAVHLRTHAGLFARALGVTVQAAAAGFVMGNLAAIGLALAATLAPRAERVISALALLVFCLPFVATGPILRVIFGPGIWPQIALAALAVYYTTYLALMVGLRAAPASWFDLVRSYGGGRVTELHHVRAVAALPYLVAGLQIAAPAAVLGAMVGEFTGADRGLGVLAIQSMRSLDVAGTWAVATVASAVAMLAYWALGLIGRRIGGAPLLLAPPRPATADAGGTHILRNVARALLIVGLALALWWGAMETFDLERFFAKRPGDVWEFLVTAPGASNNRATLFTALGGTLASVLPGYVGGLLLGASLAAAVVLSPTVGATALPVAVALRSVPIITTAPLIVLALGRGPAGPITIVAVMIFFPTLVACLQGLRQTPGQVLDIFDSYGAGRWRRLSFAQLPAMLPAFFASARMAVPAAFLAATTAEWLATGGGVGGLMALTASTSAYGMLWSAIALLSVAASLAYAGVEALERMVLRVYASEQLKA